jgi:4-alpha-glucanotransferase
MEEGCLGQINEILDGDPPHRPVGAAAQAWSVAAAIHTWRRLQATGGIPSSVQPAKTRGGQEL